MQTHAELQCSVAKQGERYTVNFRPEMHDFRGVAS